MKIDKVSLQPYKLDFKFDAGTSRGVLKHKNTSFIKVESGDKIGVGEAGPLKGLSVDDLEDFSIVFSHVLHQLEGKEYDSIADVLTLIPEQYPALRFGLETALMDLQTDVPFQIYDNDFSKAKNGIVINGLIWMGEKDFMLRQIKEKLEAGYTCVKLKIGAIDFDTELELLKYIRKEYSAQEITLRVDANGAFSPSEAIEKLNRLSEYDLHSIEQPIKAGQVDKMYELCRQTPLPIALDEELIGVNGNARKQLLESIQPQYIILKPTLVGGIQSSQEWIEMAEEQNIDWWMTSALESNVGLNAIAQFAYELNNPLPQGLGTGQLYHNNIASPLTIKGQELWYDSSINWGEL